MRKHKKIFKRSSKDKLIAGVMGGVSDYFEIDSTIIRIVWLLTLSVTGFIPGILIYILAVIIVPSDDKKTSKLDKIKRKIKKHSK